MTISGLNFNSIEPSATASLGVSAACSSTSWTSATTVACSPVFYSSGGGGMRRTVLTVSALVGTSASGLVFSFDGKYVIRLAGRACRTHTAIRLRAAPVMSGISPYNVPQTGGGLVTISGLNFNSIEPSATASLGVSVACSSTSWTSATTVACSSVSYSSGGAAGTAVTVAGIVGTIARVGFSFDGTHAPACTKVLRAVCTIVSMQFR